MKHRFWLTSLLTIFFVFGIPLFVEAQLFTRDLALGSQGEDVRLLQQYLNKDLRTRVANSGPGSVGSETTYFGPLTQAAVIRFQNLYATEVLHPLNLTTGTGYFGPSTRTRVMALLQNTNTADGPSILFDRYSGSAQELHSFANNDNAPVAYFSGLTGTSNVSPFPDDFLQNFSRFGEENETEENYDDGGTENPFANYENEEYGSWLETIVGLALQPFGGRISSIQYNCLCSLSVIVYVSNPTGRPQPPAYMFYYGAQLAELMSDFLGVEELDPSNIVDIGLPIPRLYAFYGLYPGPNVLGNYLPGQFQCWAFVGPPTWCAVQGNAEGAIVQMGTSLF